MAEPSAYGCYAPAEGGPSALGLTMESSVSAADDGWLVRYRVTNASGADRFLIADIPYPPFAGAYRPENYYLMPRINGDIEISKREFWPPESCRLPQMLVPPLRAGLIKLPAGREFSEEFLVHRPLQIRHPLGSPAISQLPPLPAQPTRALFCLGVTGAAAGASDRGLAPGDQQFLCNGPMAL